MAELVLWSTAGALVVLWLLPMVVLAWMDLVARIRKAQTHRKLMGQKFRPSL